ncbi:PCNA-interacting partner-like [Elysia marginata]|uniref:PCNA-interacting partner n=1 Tax=Elysia marginata TaxID=1093978 RepID=A0AAV4EVR6_9GAST|nr:PCNA-interacting partner-like [Elysia marginata]
MIQSVSQHLQFPMTAFIVKQCRRFSLLYNERTTILSNSDEMQLIQYCLACTKQKNKEDFEASPAETLDIADGIKNIEIKLIETHLQNFKALKAQETQNAQKDVGLLNSKESAPEDSNKSNLQVNTDLVEMKKQDEGNDAVLNDVYQLYVSHKETNNQLSILDCYVRFVKEITNDKSNLHVFMKSCKDMEIAAKDDSFVPIQTKVFDLIKDHNPCFFLDTKRDMEQMEDNPIKSNSQLTGSPEHLKTPSRVKFVNSCNSPVCSPMQSSTPKTPVTPAQKKQVQKAFVYNLFRCYIHLLVNSRSQLALTRVFNIPDRGLDHAAFTHLKHEAMSAGLSMYQYLSSFIMRIRLGGQGYAPSTSTPLMSYVKGLGCLLDFTQKLQTVVEEISDIRSACQRVVNIIKNNLIQCKSGKFKRSRVEPCASEIQASLSNIINAETAAVSSPSRTPGAEGTLIGRRCLQILQSFLDQAAVLPPSETDEKLLQDLSFSTQTPTRIPCLLSQFRSPCMLETVEEITETKGSRKQSLKAKKKVSCFVSSALYLEEDDQPILTQNTLTSIEILPSKTLVDPKASDSQEGRRKNVSAFALSTVTNDKVNQAKGTRKRKAAAAGQENAESGVILSDAAASDIHQSAAKEKQLADFEGNTPKSSKKTAGQSNVKTKKVGKSCRKRLLPQVKGQSKITGFFRL